MWPSEKNLKQSLKIRVSTLGEKSILARTATTLPIGPLLDARFHPFKKSFQESKVLNFYFRINMISTTDVTQLNYGGFN